MDKFYEVNVISPLLKLFCSLSIQQLLTLYRTYLNSNLIIIQRRGTSQHGLPDIMNDMERINLIDVLVKRKVLWILILLLPLLYFGSKINIQEVPLGHNIDGEGYFLVTELFGTKAIYSYRKGRCFASGAWECGMIKEKIDSADIQTFKTLSLRHGVDINNVYFVISYASSISSSNVNGVRIISGADKKTFTVMENSYAKDNKFVYLADKVIVGASPDDFKIIYLDNRERNKDDARSIATSNGQVFLGTQPINYGLRDGGYIIKEPNNEKIPCPNKQIYHNDSYDIYNSCNLTETGKDISVKIDVASLEILGENSSTHGTRIYAKDSQYVYFLNFEDCYSGETDTRKKCDYLNVIEKADPATIKIHYEKKPNYLSDKNYFYDRDGCNQFGTNKVRRLRSHIENNRCLYF